MRIIDFLTARYDEDYEIAYGGAPSPWKVGTWDGTFDGPREILDRLGHVTAKCYYGGTTGHVLHFDPTRVLRDIEARRKIIAFLHPCDDDAYVGTAHEDPCATLRILADVYREHPDYEPDWKP